MLIINWAEKRDSGTRDGSSQSSLGYWKCVYDKRDYGSRAYEKCDEGNQDAPEVMENVMRGTKTHPKFQSLSSHTSFVSERIGNREEFNEPRREKIHAELLAVGEACEAIF